LGYDINVNETIEDKNSWFNIKRFKIGNTRFEKPEKSIDSKNINQTVFNSLINEKYPMKFYETTKLIRSFDDIKKVYEFNQASECNEYFYHKKWLSDLLPNVLNITFNFNPFAHTNIDKIDWFFYRYYDYSKLFISIPNIRITRMYYTDITDEKTGKIKTTEEKEIIIDVDKYIEFVDSVFSILKTKNNKPIFVPISLRMSFQDLDKLIDHYLKKEYYYYWFDFEGKAINEFSIGSIRYIFNKIYNKGYFNKIISYFTNIKREITSNIAITENKSAASDVLSSIAGANIIGVNREPQKNLRNKLPNDVLRKHKTRVFDGDSYYYVRDQAISMSKEHNISHNTVELDKEFKRQSDFLLSKLNIGSYLTKKDMLTKFRNGSILKELNSKLESDESEPWF